jgi:outer membrane protein OmpA-like peptidoglycan-associated protein
VLPQIPGGIVSPTVGTPHPVYRIPNTLFAVDSSSITSSGQAALVRVATDILTRYPGLAFTCTGSADGTGGSSPTVLAVDRELSVARASEVCRYLVYQGLSAELAHSVGCGQTTGVPDPARRSVDITIGKVQKECPS